MAWSRLAGRLQSAASAAPRPPRHTSAGQWLAAVEYLVPALSTTAAAASKSTAVVVARVPTSLNGEEPSSMDAQAAPGGAHVLDIYQSTPPCKHVGVPG